MTIKMTIKTKIKIVGWVYELELSNEFAFKGFSDYTKADTDTYTEVHKQTHSEAYKETDSEADK